MADVRGASGVPGLAAFGGLATPSPSTPLYIDLATGDLYVVISEVVTLVGSIAGGSSHTIAVQSMSNHSTPIVDPVDASTQLAGRAFAAPQSVVQPDLADASAQLAGRAFGNRSTTPQAIFGTADDILATRVFGPRQNAATWS